MGLDIVVYETVTKTDDEENGKAFYSGGGFGFNQADDIEIGSLYITSGKSHSFRAGSYSGYNSWRNELCQLAHGIEAEEFWKKCQEKEITEGPFVELIHFSDCEGTLGPKTCAKLAQDFETYYEKAKDHSNGISSPFNTFLDKYEEWMESCALAADTGALRFC